MPGLAQSWEEEGRGQSQAKSSPAEWFSAFSPEREEWPSLREICQQQFLGWKARPEFPMASCRGCASRSCCCFGSLMFELLIRTRCLHGSKCQECPAVSTWGICCSPLAARHPPWPSFLAGRAALPSGQLEQLEFRNTAAKDQSWSLKCSPCQL